MPVSEEQYIRQLVNLLLFSLNISCKQEKFLKHALYLDHFNPGLDVTKEPKSTHVKLLEQTTKWKEDSWFFLPFYLKDFCVHPRKAFQFYYKTSLFLLIADLVEPSSRN